MKVHILFPNFNNPSGGSSFLTTLRQQWRESDMYAETLQEADAFLFNSHHGLWHIWATRLRYPTKVFVHRVDGPMAAYNAADRRDELVNIANTHFADATIFQSTWSQQENHRRHLPQKELEVVIPNAASSLFRPILKDQAIGEKIKLLATSWSKHPNKGFSDYAWLDAHLDPNMFDMTFVGNSPITFKNIHHVPAVTKDELAYRMQQADILIFASRVEACSNTLLEAIGCKLPVIAFDATSNRELVGKGGELYTEPEQIFPLARQIRRQYESYQHQLPVFAIADVAQRYSQFIQQVIQKTAVRSRRLKNVVAGALALASRHF